MKDFSNRRKFFDDLANSRGTDPLNPTTWYSVPFNDVYHRKVCVYKSFAYSNVVKK